MLRFFHLAGRNSYYVLVSTSVVGKSPKSLCLSRDVICITSLYAKKRFFCPPTTDLSLSLSFSLSLLFLCLWLFSVSLLSLSISLSLSLSLYYPSIYIFSIYIYSLYLSLSFSIALSLSLSLSALCVAQPYKNVMNAPLTRERGFTSLPWSREGRKIPYPSLGDGVMYQFCSYIICLLNQSSFL
jgi:hypothetical protein